ncbi:MAG: LLM class flavin-dependent oxidoreductase, partial [Thermoproteota archaeon]|nr:LLM class flavin-dependent oxidoreductase [Thermoproteota archaeon]
MKNTKPMFKRVYSKVVIPMTSSDPSSIVSLETLTFVAANTNKIALGTSVMDMLFHNPVILARRFATLDVLSEGRTI